MNGISAVIPVLNGAATLPNVLSALAGAVDEVVVVDGGSVDASVPVAAAGGARVVICARGRGVQVSAGVAAARGEWLLLLHADTCLGAGWEAVARGLMGEATRRAGYFRFALDSDDPRARRLERLVAWRCRLLALPYGDQGLLLPRALLEAVGGVRALPLMEDVDLVRRIGRTRLVALDAVATTSATRWERDGWRRRSARNLVCLMLYLCGVPPRIIARLYA